MFTLRFKKWKIQINYDVLITLIMLIFTLVYFQASKKLSYEALLFPKLLYVVIGITGFLSLRGSIAIGKKEEITSPGQFENENKDEEIKFGKDTLIFTGLVFALIFSLKILGSVLGIVVFLIASMKILKVKNNLLVVLVAILTALFIYFVFKIWLSISLPTGILGI